MEERRIRRRELVAVAAMVGVRYFALILEGFGLAGAGSGSDGVVLMDVVNVWKV